MVEESIVEKSQAVGQKCLEVADTDKATMLQSAVTSERAGPVH